MRRMASEDMIVRLVNEMFSRAVEMDASDIHVEPDEKKLAIRFRIDGVTGPDEYTAVVDNNVYNNLMAQRNLEGAVAAVKRHQDRAAELGVTYEEVAAWRRAAENMFIPYDENLGVHPQSEGFTDHQEWDFKNTPADRYPLMLHYPYHDLYRKQVVKQADLVLAMHLRGDAFTPEQKARNFSYYEPLTVRDFSLSSCTQAVVAAEVGQIDLAYDYLGEAARMDLDNLERNTGDGLHIASLAGAWIALVAGFGGMRDHGGRLTFAPRLPGTPGPGCAARVPHANARPTRAKQILAPSLQPPCLALASSPARRTDPTAAWGR